MSDPRETPVTVQTFLNQGSEKADGSSNQLSQASGSKGPTGSQNGPRSKKGPAEQRKEESTPSQPAKIDNNQTQELTSMLNVLGFQLGEGSQQPTNVDLIDQLSNMGFGQEEDRKFFICRNLLLLEEGVLKVFTKDQEGSYFSNMQSFGSRLSKATIDRKHGKFVAVGGEDGVSILSRSLTDDKIELYHTLQIGKPKEMWFSNTGRYLTLFSRKESKNWILVVDLTSKSVVLDELFGGIVIKEQYPLVKFSADDSLAFLHTKPEEVRVLSPAEHFTSVQNFVFEPCDYIVLSQLNTSEMQIARIVKHNESNDVKRLGRLIVSTYPNLYDHELDQTFARAHEIKLEWAPSGEGILIQTNDFIDETGRSYYGQNYLYLFTNSSREFKQIMTYAGPIHTFSWFPRGGQFIVQSGFMPAHTVIYNHRGDPELQLGIHHRNTLKWAPLQRFLLVGGFENLKGEIDIWDMQEMKQVGTCTSTQASFAEWAPDGRHFLTAIVEQTLRVSNEVNIFKYDGSLFEKLRCPSNKLNEVVWLPSCLNFEDRPATPDNEKVTQDAIKSVSQTVNLQQDPATKETEIDDAPIHQDADKILQLVPSAANALAPMDSGVPKKRKMNLQWDDSQDIFTKAEGMKTLTTDDILAFNRNYDDSLMAQQQKSKDAQDKLDKKRAQMGGEGNGKLKTPQAAPALQRGTFKRGEEVKKEAPEPKDSEKHQNGNSKSNNNQDAGNGKGDQNKKGQDKQQNQPGQSKKAQKQKDKQAQNAKDQAQAAKQGTDKVDQPQKAADGTSLPEGDKPDAGANKKPANEPNNNKSKKNQQNKQPNPTAPVQADGQPSQTNAAASNAPNQNPNQQSKKDAKKNKEAQDKPENPKQAAATAQPDPAKPKPRKQLKPAGSASFIPDATDVATDPVKPAESTPEPTQAPVQPVEPTTQQSPDKAATAAPQTTKPQIEAKPVESQDVRPQVSQEARPASQAQAPLATQPSRDLDNQVKTVSQPSTNPASIAVDPAISAIHTHSSVEMQSEGYNRGFDSDPNFNPALVDQAIASAQVVKQKLRIQNHPDWLPMGGNPESQRMHPNGQPPVQPMMNQMNRPMPIGHNPQVRGPVPNGPSPQRPKGQRIVAPPGMQMPEGSPQGGMFFPRNMPDFYDPAFHQPMYQGPDYGHPGNQNPNPNYYHQDPNFQDPALFYMQGLRRGGHPVYSPPSPRGYEHEDPRFFPGYPQYPGPPHGQMYPPQHYPPQKVPMGYPPGLHPGNPDPRRPMGPPGNQMGMPINRGPPGMHMGPPQPHVYPPNQMPHPGMMRGPQNGGHPGPYPNQNYSMTPGAFSEEEFVQHMLNMENANRANGPNPGDPAQQKQPKKPNKRPPVNQPNQASQGPN